MVAHRNLTGADLHEPKGIAGASDGDVYIADGEGSGSWEDLSALIDAAIALLTASSLGAETLGVSRGWESKSSSHTLELTDAGKTIEMSNASARTITIPLNATVAFPIPTYVNLARGGTGSVQIVGAEGVTIRAPKGTYLDAQYSMATIQKKSTNEWWLAGDLKESA